MQPDPVLSNRLRTGRLSAIAWLGAVFAGMVLVCASFATDQFPLERVVQAAQQRYGGPAASVVRDWGHVMDVFKSDSETEKLKDINEYFNRKLRFASDQEVWGVPDYWATPIEALMKGAGDCEDYAIAKYVSLKFLGVSVSKMRLTYVKARIGGPDSPVTQAHMVLTYYPTPDAEPLVLDNLVSEIRPASRRKDLLPIFSFNSEGLYMAGSKDPLPGGGSRLNKWNDVVEKMKAEGLE